MSDTSQGPGWWQASDGKWYPPEAVPGTPEASPTPTAAPQPGYGPPGYGPPGYGQPGYGPQSYGQPGYGYPYAMPTTATGLPSVQGLAVASLVCGILGFLPCCTFNSILALVAVPLGAVALSRINKGQADPSSKGMAVAGVVLGGIGIVLGILWIAIFVVADSGSM